jgi:CSLREA domain-containing protein
LLIGITAVILAALAWPGAPAEAASYTPTKFNDTFDGTCDADCSLRDALWAANNTPGPHDIYLSSGTYTLTIQGANEGLGWTGDLDVFNDVYIEGQGLDDTIIDASALNDRVMHLDVATLTLSGVRLRGGSNVTRGGGIYSTGDVYAYYSALSGNTAVDDGGGIFNDGGYLQLTDSTVANNTVSSEGGGVFSYGPISVTGSTISGNQSTNNANGAGGGIYTWGTNSAIGSTAITNNHGGWGGGGIHYEGGTHTISITTISGNSAAIIGGGLNQMNANTTITDTIISGNQSNQMGGGIGNQSSTLTLGQSTLFGNSASFGGGGLHNYGTANLTNTTISGNGAGVRGGGVNNPAGTTTLLNTTINGNSAGSTGGGIYNDAGGTPPVVSHRNTIITSNPPANCGGTPTTTAGFNLTNDGSCTQNGPGDINNIYPVVEPLAYNGGPTPTHALAGGSFAGDAGGPGCPATDQRGIARPQGIRCDIGAYEAPDTDGDGISDPADSNDDNDSLLDGYDTCQLAAEDYDAFLDADGCPDPDNDGDNICDAGQTGLACTGSDSGKNCFDPAGTLSCPTRDCRNAAEDADAFKDTDGCPEPDNDNDAKLDAADVCPGTNSLAGADGMLGSPQDLNHNGIRDAGAPWNEAALTTDDSPSALAFEDYDGVLDADGCHDSPGADFDGDGFTDDSEVFTHLTDAGNPDTDADTVIDGADNCPNWANTPQNLPSWTIPANDSDCDGFTVAREQWTGTDPTKHCANTSTPNDEADAWPSDFNDSRVTNLSDVVLMGPVYNQSTGTDPAKRRFDLNASGAVNLSDVVLMGPFYNKGCG